MEKLLVQSPENTVTPPVRTTSFPLARSASSAALSTPEPLPLHSTSKANRAIDDETRKNLDGDIQKAKTQLKGDKNAAKSAVKALKEGLSKPGKTAAAKGKGRGRGRGKGRGKGSRGSNKKEEEEALEEPEEEDEELDEIQNVEVENLDEEDSHSVQSIFGSDISATTLELGEVPKKKPANKAKAKVQPKSSTTKGSTAADKMKAKKNKQADDHKKKLVEINERARARIKALKDQKKKIEDENKTKKRTKDAAKTKDETKRPDKTWTGNLKEEMYKFIQAETAKLKEGGMGAKEALAAARESCFGCFTLGSQNIPKQRLTGDSVQAGISIHL